MKHYLEATKFIESDRAEILGLAKTLTDGINGKRERTKVLFYFVRDRIVFRPLFFNYLPKEEFKASITLQKGHGFCITKAIFLISLLRSMGIPSRFILADIRHHQLSNAIKKELKTDIIPHGFLEVFLGNKWIKLNPTYNLNYCKAMDYPPTEFDGENDALFPAVDNRGNKLIEYVQIIGQFPDLPYDLLLSHIRDRYGTLDKDFFWEINRGDTFYRGWS